MNNILKRKICLFFDDTKKKFPNKEIQKKKKSHCKLKNSDDPSSNFLLTKKTCSLNFLFYVYKNCIVTDYTYIHTKFNNITFHPESKPIY